MITSSVKSNDWDTYDPFFIVDGKTDTFWESNFDVNDRIEWIVLDLGEPYSLQSIGISWQYRPSKYSIQLSNDPDVANKNGSVLLACGATTGTCSGQTLAADSSETHEARCCSDIDLGSGWTKNAVCDNVWSRSEDINGVCQDALNYGEALDMCANLGGRLCTAEELLADCTRDTGCAHNDDLIWSSTDAVTSLFNAASIELPGTDAVGIIKTTDISGTGGQYRFIRVYITDRINQTSRGYAISDVSVSTTSLATSKW